MRLTEKQTEAIVPAIARALNKSRFYDVEPEMYESVEAFFAKLDCSHVDEAEWMARAALDAVQETHVLLPCLTGPVVPASPVHPQGS